MVRKGNGGQRGATEGSEGQRRAAKGSGGQRRAVEGSGQQWRAAEKGSGGQRNQQSVRLRGEQCAAWCAHLDEQGAMGHPECVRQVCTMR